MHNLKKIQVEGIDAEFVANWGRVFFGDEACVYPYGSGEWKDGHKASNQWCGDVFLIIIGISNYGFRGWLSR